jgi:DNA-binding NarL/FixJ family response regulator
MEVLRMKVLVVDDSLLVRQRLSNLFTHIPGVESTEETGDAYEAVEAVRQRPPDVVILDVQITGGNSFIVLKTAKAQKPAPCVIVLTNNTEAPYRRKYMEGGADYFFDKSTQFEKAMEQIERLCGKAAG